MRMHQDVLVAALPEPPILAFSPLASAYPVELAVFSVLDNKRRRVIHERACAKEVPLSLMGNHTPAGTKEGRGRGCLVSHCTPFAGVVLSPIALHPPGPEVPRDFIFILTWRFCLRLEFYQNLPLGGLGGLMKLRLLCAGRRSALDIHAPTLL